MAASMEFRRTLTGEIYGFVYAARLVWVFWLAAFLASMGYSMARPAIAFYTRYALGGSGLEVSLLTTGFMAARAISAPFSGHVGDRAPHLRAWMMRIGVILGALVIYALSCARSPYVAIGLMTTYGFIGGMLWPTIHTLIGVSAPPGLRGRVLALYFTSGSSG
ncbi:MAG: MFS transporter, partial [Candidatus Korarchaeota archaeon]|nr:MFS transporter [Candidatus Korarchaeota archaeon]